MVIRIDFDDFHSSLAHGSNFLQHRSESAARSTPISPEVYQDRLLGFQDFHLKVRLVDFQDWFHLVAMLIFVVHVSVLFFNYTIP